MLINNRPPERERERDNPVVIVVHVVLMARIILSINSIFPLLALFIIKRIFFSYTPVLYYVVDSKHI